MGQTPPPPPPPPPVVEPRLPVPDGAHVPPPPPPVIPAAPEGAEEPPVRKHRPFWRELPVLIVIAFVIALLLKSFVIQAFFIPSASMEPTLMIGDRVLVEKVSLRFGEPDRGDVVVFEKDLSGADPADKEDRNVFEKIADTFRGLFGFPVGTSQDFIKRVIAVGGDTIEGKDGIVYVNGEPLDEDYLPDGVQTSTFGPVEIPEDQIFVMGDNRGNSDDSRSFGPVEVNTVVGRAFILIWPPSDFSTL